MSASSPAGASEQEPLQVVLEFVRAEQAGDPHGFRFGSQVYLLRSAGGGFASAELTWDEALLAQLAAVRLPGRDPALVQRLGETLRSFVSAAGWAGHEPEILAAVARQQRVILTFCSAAAELYALPWELLTLQRTGQHLGELPQVLLRYQWPETRAASPNALPPAAERILVAWSAAAGAVPAAEHLAAVQQACKAAALPFDAEHDELPRASFARLQHALMQAQKEGRPIGVLHLLCHGAAVGSTFGLAFHGESAEQDAVVVDAARLRQLLAPFAAMVRLVVLAACDSGNTGALGNHLGSIAQTLHRAGIAAVVASRYPLSVSGSNRLAQTFYQQLLAGPDSLETALLLARSNLAQDPESLDWASLQLYAHPSEGEDTRPLQLRPYRGLLAFWPQHHRFFFGRDREIAEICKDLAALSTAGKPRFLVVAGASGSGKSSVVLAGAVPRLLAQQPRMRFVSVRPSASLQEVLTAASDANAKTMPLLVVVDQLEEVFTHIPEPAQRSAFVQELWRLAKEPSSQVQVIVTLRVDFMGRCGELTLDPAGLRLDSIAYDEAHRVFVSQLGPDALRAAIEQPAQAVGLRCEPGLTQRMTADVGAEPGALPLLEDTLDLLWQKRRGRSLTQAAYDEVGGVTGALQSRANALIDGLENAEQACARRLFRSLISLAEDVAQSTRKRVALTQLRPSTGPAAARFDKVLAQLVTARLLVLDGQGTTQLVEVAHEALLRKWPRLHDWVRADREMLRELEKIHLWLHQYDEFQTLLQGSQLERVVQFQKDHPDDFPAQAQALLAASQRQVRQQQRRRQWTQALVLLTAAAFSVLGWFGLQQARRASQEARSGRDSVRMMALREFAGAPTIQAGLLREFEADDLAAVPGWRQAATTVLRNTAQQRATWRVAAPSGVLFWALAADCIHYVTVTSAGQVTVADKEHAVATLQLPESAAAVQAVAISPDASTLLVAWSDHRAQLLRVDGSAPPVTLPDVRWDAARVGFTVDGQRAWLMDKSHLVWVWDAKGQAGPTALSNGSSTSSGAVSIRDEEYLFATAEPDGVSLIGETLHRRLLFERAAQVDSVTLCTQPGQLVTSTNGGFMTSWSLGQPPLEQGLVTVPLPQASRVRFSPDGRRLLVGSQNGIAQLLNYDGAGKPVVFRGEGSLTSASFSSNSRKLKLTFNGAVSEVWNADGSGIPFVVPAGITHALSPDGSRLGAADQTGKVRVLSTENGQLLATLSEAGRSVSLLRFSPRGDKLAAMDSDNSVTVYSADGSGVPTQLHLSAPHTMTFNQDGSLLLFVRSGQPVLTWNLQPSSAPVPVGEPLDDARFGYFGIGPLRQHIASMNDKLQLVLASPLAQQRPAVLSLPGIPLLLRFSADESRLLIGHEDRESTRDFALLWQTSGTGATQAVPFEGSRIIDADLHPDGKIAALIGEDLQATLWNLDRLDRVDAELLRAQLWRSSVRCPAGAEVAVLVRKTRDDWDWDFRSCEQLGGDLEVQPAFQAGNVQSADYQKRLKHFRARQSSWLRGSTWSIAAFGTAVVDSLADLL